MNLRRKNAAIAILTATLMASGIMTTANAAEDDWVSGSVTVQRNYVVDSAISVKKNSASGSAGYIKIQSAIPANDTVYVNIKNQNDNIVSTGDCQCRNITSETTKAISYQPNKGKKGNSFYPSFTLAANSYSPSFPLKYEFKP